MLRRMAVTLQLAVSVVFILAASVVMMQMRFVNHKDLGFDRNGIVQLLRISGLFGKSGSCFDRQVENCSPNRNSDRCLFRTSP